MLNIKVTKAGTLTGHTSSVYSLVQHPEIDSAFISGSGDGKVIRWDLSNLSEAVMLAQVKANIFSMLILPRKNILLIGQMQGGIHVLDLKEKKELRHIAHHQQGVFDIQADGNYDRIFTGGGDGVLSIWDNEFTLRKSIQVSPKSIRQIALHPSKPFIAMGCSDNSVYIIDSNDFKTQQHLQEHSNSVFSVCFSPDGRYLLSGSRDAHLRVWDIENDFRLKLSLPAHLFTINCIVYSPDGKYFATASRDKSIKLWDAESFELLKVIDKAKSDGHVNSVNKLIWTSYDNLLVSCSDDRSIMVWKIEG